MDADRDLTTPDRVMRLFQFLGIERAHLGQGLEDVALPHPEVVASLALLLPHSGMASGLRAMAAHHAPVPLFLAHGDAGQLAGAAPHLRAARPDASVITLRDYKGAYWSDLLAERGDELAPALLA